MDHQNGVCFLCEHSLLGKVYETDCCKKLIDVNCILFKQKKGQPCSNPTCDENSATAKYVFYVPFPRVQVKKDLFLSSSEEESSTEDNIKQEMVEDPEIPQPSNSFTHRSTSSPLLSADPNVSSLPKQGTSSQIREETNHELMTLVQQIKKAHRLTKPPKLYPCLVCKRPFANRGNRKKHAKKVHPEFQRKVAAKIQARLERRQNQLKFEPQ